MEEYFSSFLRRAGMPASAGLSCHFSDVLSLGYTDVLLWRNSVNFVHCGVQIDLIAHDTHRIFGYVYLKTWKRSKQQ